MATLLAERHPQLRLALVDPSPLMRSQAAGRCADLITNARVTIADGTAENLGLADASRDTVLAVNSVALWPNPSAALAKIHRARLPVGSQRRHQRRVGSGWGRPGPAEFIWCSSDRQGCTYLAVAGLQRAVDPLSSAEA
jgi:ubiquinone/menaquinone biosynthesis C-methylase UbiE